MSRHHRQDTRRRAWYGRALVLVLLLTLTGCETINDAVVRSWLMDSGLGNRVNKQIKEGLKKKEISPPVTGPRFPAPQGLDQG
ncbi:hypothetical protein L4X63_11945 [Geomonas sp. Red32]|uniref:hypothetical protein n=1 Tax=Geomonas sp. Red32 TaxID=2912856 RepID=UPI00202D0169|nr:hypothetical protein [Geomonas sp. Red32]MCM0082301.1 hypothetical protein [Geomonas sp. Red32]